MSAYIKLATLEYPRHEGDIRNEYPEITEDQTGPDFPCPATYALVEDTPCPEFVFDTQVAYEIEPVQINGVWKQVWEVRDLTAEEIANREEAKRQKISPTDPI
jgi:hypothetical protein